MNRATYQVFHMPGFLCVIDLDQGKSVTNDAENVLADLAAELPEGTRLVYRDTAGIWDEIEFALVDGVPHLKGFRSLNQTSMGDAIAFALGMYQDLSAVKTEQVLEQMRSKRP